MVRRGARRKIKPAYAGEPTSGPPGSAWRWCVGRRATGWCCPCREMSLEPPAAGTLRLDLVLTPAIGALTGAVYAAQEMVDEMHSDARAVENHAIPQAHRVRPPWRSSRRRGAGWTLVAGWAPAARSPGSARRWDAGIQARIVSVGAARAPVLRVGPRGVTASWHWRLVHPGGVNRGRVRLVLGVRDEDATMTKRSRARRGSCGRLLGRECVGGVEGGT